MSLLTLSFFVSIRCKLCLSVSWFYLQCRMSVDRISKNHIVNNLIEAYLKEHPGELNLKAGSHFGTYACLISIVVFVFSLRFRNDFI